MDASLSNSQRQAKADYSEQAGQELTALNDGPSLVHVGSEKKSAGSPEKHKQERDQLRQEQEDAGIRAKEHQLQAAREREAEIERRLTEQAESLRTDHEDRHKELQRSHAQEKASMTEAFQTSQAALQAQLDELNSQLGSFREKMKRVEESILNRDYKRHIQDYGSPSQFWEQELESLHFVIEMKNERLHELDKKLLTLQMVMERNLSLEEKVTALQQDNEDLRVQIQNHVSVTRQLSEELQAMQDTLEKETQVRQQLHHEKEELLYRVLNDQTLPCFHLSATAPEVSLVTT